MKEHKYTKADFIEYKNNIISWLSKFGITEYEVDFKHHQIDTVARTTYDVKAKLACFQLTKVSQYDYCLQDDLNKLACHEVIHLLLAEFGYTIHETKDYDCDLAIAAEHSVVMRLTKALN